MITIFMVLMVVAFALFVTSAVGLSAGSINLQSLGLAFWAMAIIVGGLT